ncbi:hypothetical protein Y026_1801 [Burkholderia pseudomallei TSV28]|nr:hypothetical protein Y026_1801 [Burkholderia pseudomallei TSV28]
MAAGAAFPRAAPAGVLRAVEFALQCVTDGPDCTRFRYEGEPSGEGGRVHSRTTIESLGVRAGRPAPTAGRG